MKEQDVVRWFDAVCGLPLRQQAICVRLAAEANVSRWQAWCRQRGIKDLTSELLTCFDRWLDGNATDNELNTIAEKFHESLPEDIAAAADPAGGYAGWALRDIPMIALDQCEDVHEDIVHTAICFAAAANAGIGPEAVWVKLSRLTNPELQFLSAWWKRCCQQFPELTNPC